MSNLTIPNTNEKSSVQVAVRIRPLNSRENRTELITNIINNTIILTNPDDSEKKNFTFDYVYDYKDTQEIIYNTIGKQVIDNSFKGYNCCIFAYGQTGCFAKDTKIVMIDETNKNIQDIMVGDLILGDDMTPRVVLQLFRGVQKLYKIIPMNNEPEFIVNQDHILVFRKRANKHNNRNHNNNYNDKHVEIVELPLTRYLELTHEEKLNLKCFTKKTKYCHSETEFNINVEPLAEDAFYGFNLSGNGRFIGAGNHVLKNSGKSFTMMGDTTVNPGLIPRICQDLYYSQEKNNNNITYRVELSYLEIYSEEVRDLLKKNNPPGGLKVRQHPEYGPYVENLTQVIVEDYKTIKHLIDQGNKERIVASTLMNNTSSRSHAILTLHLTQIIEENEIKKSREMVSKINLVDLAGSERVESSGVTGVNFKEAVNINKSLSALGLVITKLVAKSRLENGTSQGTSKIFSKTDETRKRNISQIESPRDSSVNSLKSQKKLNYLDPTTTSTNNLNTEDVTYIPFRDSVLTWILKESLGGNSKTYMIATISPSSLNYAETLNTLRYAYNAKQIVNIVKINEDPNDKIIRILKEEIEALKTKIKFSSDTPPDEINKLREELAQREDLMKEKEKSWEQKLIESKNLGDEMRKQLKKEMEEKQSEFIKQLEFVNSEKNQLLTQLEQMKISMLDKESELIETRENYEQRQNNFEKQKILDTAISLQEYYERKIETLKDLQVQKIKELENSYNEKTKELENSYNEKTKELENSQGEKIKELETAQGEKIKELETARDEITKIKLEQHNINNKFTKQHQSQMYEKSQMSKYIQQLQLKNKNFEQELKKLNEKNKDESQDLRIIISDSGTDEQISDKIELEKLIENKKKIFINLKQEYIILQEKYELLRQEYDSLSAKCELLKKKDSTLSENN